MGAEFNLSSVPLLGDHRGQWKAIPSQTDGGLQQLNYGPLAETSGPLPHADGHPIR